MESLYYANERAGNHLAGAQKFGWGFDLLSCSDHPVGVAEAARLLQISKKSASTYLSGLCDLGQLKWAGNTRGYQLEDRARALFFAPSPRAAAASVAAAGPAEPAPASLPEPEINPELKQALAAAGILLNARTRRLAGLPHITPDYVRAHHQVLVKRSLGRQTGMLICILEDGLPPPELHESGHLQDCTCRDCQRSRYSQWER